jgi:hypothetical protein
MCLGCCRERVEQEGGVWPEITPVMRLTSELIDRLYGFDMCGVGGPLHIVTDDDNVTDNNLTWCAESLADIANDAPAWWTPHLDQVPEMVGVASAILTGLWSMSVAERAVSVRLREIDQVYQGLYPPPPLEDTTPSGAWT